jgi:hypothetical protein
LRVRDLERMETTSHPIRKEPRFQAIERSSRHPSPLA